jgi:ATP-dependent Clp protease adaptor protein ClpS
LAEEIDCRKLATPYLGAVMANVLLSGTRTFGLPEEEYDLDVLEAEPSEIVLYNDNVNTFDWVIESLIDVCGHEEIQAAQCAQIVHYKGKCSVKMGYRSKLEPMCFALCDRGLSAVIE